MKFENQIICGDWHGCYDDGWTGIIVPEAFAHPAKMAYGLTRRIFKHALSEGWIKPGDVVVDPFGGIGSTGIVGACLGLQVVCVELEPRFQTLGCENFLLHCKKGWCTCGDGQAYVRNLRKIIRESAKSNQKKEQAEEGAFLFTELPNALEQRQRVEPKDAKETVSGSTERKSCDGEKWELRDEVKKAMEHFFII